MKIFLEKIKDLFRHPKLWYGLGLSTGSLLFGTILSTYEISTVKVRGPSMRPTLEPNDYVLVANLTGSDEAVIRDQVGCVVFAIAGSEERRLVKRLVKVEKTDAGVECWLQSDASQIGDRHYFDSNIFGPVKESSIKGRVVGIVYPLTRIKRL